MKILVDKMPKTPEECAYSNANYLFIGDPQRDFICSKGNFICENVFECPFFKEYNPYELPEPLGFNLRKAVAYAKEHNMEVKDIPKEILETLR